MLPGLAFLEHLGDLFGFFAGSGLLALGQCIVVLIPLELLLPSFQFLQIGPEVVVEHLEQGVWGVAVQIDQASEACFWALHHPVDRPFFIGLQVIFIEVFAEVFADVFADRVFNEAQIFSNTALWESDFQELTGTGDDVVFKPLTIQNRDDGIGIRLELNLANRLADFGFIGSELFVLSGA